MPGLAERLGTDHQRLQQFITSATWDYAGRSVARWFAPSRPVEALVVTRAGISDEVRHREKWRPAPDMTDEMAGPGGRDVVDLVTAAGRPAR